MPYEKDSNKIENIFAKLGEVKSILVVQPHYDDNDIFAGGFLSLLADKGVNIIYLTVTDDKVGVIDQTLTDLEMEKKLRKEQKNAAKLMGNRIKHEWLNFPDAGDYDYFEVRKSIIEKIRKYKPQVLMTCDPWLRNEAHHDHLITGKAVAEAAILYPLRRLKTKKSIDHSYKDYELKWVVFYATDKPNSYVDVSAVFEQKKEIIKKYQMQFTDKSQKYLLSFLEAQANKLGNKLGMEKAEVFKVLSPIQLHGWTDN